MKGFVEMTSLEDVNQLIQKEDKVLVFIYGETCSVCHAVLPQIKPMIEKYDTVQPIQINHDKVPAVASEFTVFTVPAVLLFVEGKEVLRQARFIDKDRLNFQLSRVTAIMKD